MKTNVDFITQGNSHGPVAQRLASNGNLNADAMRPFLHVDKQGVERSYITVFTGGDKTVAKNYAAVAITTNATLRRDEWKTLDDAVLKISESRLNGIQDLIKNGLTYQLGNAMGTTVLEWHDVSDAFEAELSMDGVSRSKGDRMNFQFNYLPIPIIHVDYEINARALAASRSLGNPLDTTSAERASRKVAEKLESMLFTDTSFAYGEKDQRTRNAIYSYLNHPDRNLASYSNAPWNEIPATENVGKIILTDVRRLKQTAIDAKHYGPYKIYIPTQFETILDDDYDATTPGTTIRERIMKVANIQGIMVNDTLAAGNIVLVQMTSDVVRLVQGMGIQNVQWQTEGMFVNKYKVMTIQVPQIRSDQEGRCGIVHMS